MSEPTHGRMVIKLSDGTTHTSDPFELDGPVEDYLAKDSVFSTYTQFATFRLEINGKHRTFNPAHIMWAELDLQ